MKNSTTRLTQGISTRKTLPGAIKALIALAFWLLVWALLSRLVSSELLLPSPAAVLLKFLELGRTGKFWSAVGFTLLRIFGGCLAGILLGVGLAALTHVSKTADCLLSPLIRTIRATPVASLIILALLWIGRSLVPAFLPMLMVIPLVWAGVRSAAAEVDAGLLEMSRAFRFGRLKRLRLIYIPSILPSFSSVCGTAVGLAWKSGVAAEVLCLPGDAIGTRLYYAKIYLETGELFAWTAVVIILSFVLENLLAALLRRVSPRGESVEKT